MDTKDRDGRDLAGVGPYAKERERLVGMSTLESWKFASGEPDIRGWEVQTVSGRQLGSVGDLLVDQQAGEVVLLDIDLPGTDRHTFVPIRVVEIDRDRRIVFMDSADLPESDLVRLDGRPIAAVQPVLVEREVPVTDLSSTGDRRVNPRRAIDRNK